MAGEPANLAQALFTIAIIAIGQSSQNGGGGCLEGHRPV